jgi:N-methylhydantoinase A
MAPAVVGVDVGGTFTDFVMVSADGAATLKVPSTPDDLTEAVLIGLRRLLSDLDGHTITHGSTVATNALLERKGARTALIATRGFEDVLEIGRQARPALYDLSVQKPPPLVPRSLRFGVRERVSADGQVLEPLDPEQLGAVVEAVRASGAESLGVCLLFSFRRPEHESAIGRQARVLGIPISLSSEVLPEFREFERCSTTVVNAYLAPVAGRYHAALGKALRGCRVRIMQSSGGCASAQAASRQPVRLLLSGPAGGALGAREVALRAGERSVIALDMGGTSTDVSLCRDGELHWTTATVIDGSPVCVPMIDVHTVGAGGGSIAWLDDGGALRVGPQSAGADPGPACYGKGDAATVTDAHLVLGRFGPEPRLGGTRELDRRRAEEAIAEIAARAGLEPLECARGIIDVANATMRRAMRVLSVERGHDPRGFCLVAFGGAGPLHACELAAGLSIPRALVPAHAGVLSAYGLLVADVVKHYSRTVMIESRAGADAEQLRPELAPVLDALSAQALREMADEGFPASELTVTSSADVRYRGQSFELNVPLGGDLIEAFHQAHERTYGHRRDDQPVQIVTVRLRAVGRCPKPELPAEQSRSGPADTDLGNAKAYIGGRWEVVGLRERKYLTVGERVPGPAIVLEDTCTTFVAPGFVGEVDPWGNLALTQDRPQRAGGSR